MTIFSLGNACDLEHFSGNTKLNQENFDMPNYQAPVVPMPTEPPNKPFGETKYKWRSNSAAAQNMTSRDMDSGTFNSNVGDDSQGWGAVNFGPDYWEENEDSYTSSNKLLNETNGVVMPNMRPQSAFMPTMRSHIVNNEDGNGRDIRNIKKKGKKMPKIILEPPVVFPPFDSNKIENDTKNLWFFLIVLLIVVVGSVMYKSNYF